MDKKTQDCLWACLPKEARDEIKNDYNSHPSAYHPYFNEGYGEALKIYFGKHNLTSDTEPEEMLMVERKQVQEYYKDVQQAIGEENGDTRVEMEGRKMAMRYFFGDKCLPDKEAQNIPKHSNSFQIGKIEQPSVQGEPKFKVGELAMNYGKKCRILDYNPDGKFPYLIHILYNNLKTNVSEFDLEPYTEPSNVSADETKNETKDMEEKELNLCELLKGCEGERFYSPISNEPVTLRSVFECSLTFLIDDEGDLTVDFDKQGHITIATLDGVSQLKCITDPNSLCLVYPSRALYEKYPLDAYSAWMEWKEARKPKRWRAEKGEKYWRLDSAFQSIKTLENNDSSDEKLYECCNYFRTKEEAQQAAEGVRETLMKIHEKNVAK